MVFHEACLQQAGEAKCISTVFHYLIEQKKTLLFIFTQAILNGDQKLEFENVFFSDKIDDLEKINSIKTFLTATTLVLVK